METVLLNYSITPIQQFSYTTGKNATDAALIIDASVISFDNNRWEVEVKSDQRNIVARSHDVLTIDEIVSKGFDLCQEALDLLSVERKGELQIKAPAVTIWQNKFH